MTELNNNVDADILIAGGGLAGLSLALQICKKRPQTTIKIIEAGSFPRAKAVTKIGESTVEIFSYYLRERLSLKDFLRDKQLKKFGIRMFFGQAESIDQLDELGASKAFGLPTYQIDRGDLENELVKQLAPYDVQILEKCHITQIDAEADIKSLSFTNDQSNSKTLKARWLVDCSGRAGLLKKTLNLASANEHNQHALWFRVNKTIRIDDWSDKPSWHSQCSPEKERWLSTNHFTGAGYWLWIIPLSSGATSIGIVFDDSAFSEAGIHDYASCLNWIEKNQPLCRKAIGDAQAMDFVIANDYSYGASKLFSDKRWALIGEAGVFADPFYSPGGDFIALGNDFCAGFIAKDLEGFDARIDIVVANKVMLAIYENTLRLYQNIYGGFGDRKLMSIKLLWDYAYYWGILAYAYWTDSLRDPQKLRSIAGILTKSQTMNKEVQQALAKRAEKRMVQTPKGLFLDQYQATCLQEFHQLLHQAKGTDDPIPLLEQHLEKLAGLKDYCIQQLSTENQESLKPHSFIQRTVGRYHQLVQQS